MSRQTIEITDQNFAQEVEDQEGVVLLDLWAEWCGPCKMLEPIIEEIADEYGDQIRVGKLDVDQNQGVAQKLGVRSIPTVLFFKDGKQVDGVVGAVPKRELTRRIEQHL